MRWRRYHLLLCLRAETLHPFIERAFILRNAEAIKPDLRPVMYAGLGGGHREVHISENLFASIVKTCNTSAGEERDKRLENKAGPSY